MSPPYACAYTNGAKQGNNALLAVSTEQGVVHIVDTAKRQEWDVGALVVTGLPWIVAYRLLCLCWIYRATAYYIARS